MRKLGGFVLVCRGEERRVVLFFYHLLFASLLVLLFFCLFFLFLHLIYLWLNSILLFIWKKVFIHVVPNESQNSHNCPAPSVFFPFLSLLFSGLFKLTKRVWWKIVSGDAPLEISIKTLRSVNYLIESFIFIAGLSFPFQFFYRSTSKRKKCESIPRGTILFLIFKNSISLVSFFSHIYLSHSD